jgi:hypothetical protein
MLLAAGPPAAQTHCLLLLLQAVASSLSQLLHQALLKHPQLWPLHLRPAPFAAARRCLPHQQHPHHQLLTHYQHADACVAAGCAAPAV